MNEVVNLGDDWLDIKMRKSEDRRQSKDWYGADMKIWDAMMRWFEDVDDTRIRRCNTQRGDDVKMRWYKEISSCEDLAYAEMPGNRMVQKP